jgi:hypothetical protein
VKQSLAQRWLVAGAILVGAVVLAILTPSALLAGAPIIALTLALAVGWFPGEDTIARLRDGRAPRLVRRALASRVARPRPVAPAGRLLICFALANRPPPALPVA